MPFSYTVGAVVKPDSIDPPPFEHQGKTYTAYEVTQQWKIARPIREAISRGDYSLTINPEKQARHMPGAARRNVSVATVSSEELQSALLYNVRPREAVFAAQFSLSLHRLFRGYVTMPAKGR